MKRFANLILLLLMFLIYLSGCIESSVIGDDIIKGDEISVEFSDTSTIVAKSLRNDSIKVYPVTKESFLLGQLENNIVGKSNADIYCDFVTLGSAPEFGSTYDSIVMTVFFDTLLNHGIKDGNFEFEVYELAESLVETETDTLYSNNTFEYNPIKIGQGGFIPSFVDSISVIEPGDDTIKFAEAVRIRLDDELGNRFFQDTVALKNDTLFKQMFKGIYIKATSNAKAIVGFARENTIGNYSTKIELYSSKDSELSKSIFNLDNVVSNFYHDYTGAEVVDFFDSADKGQDFLYIQGLEGIKIDLEIKNLDFLKNADGTFKNINKAELVLYALMDEDVPDLPPRIVSVYEDEEGTKKAVEDYTFGVLTNDSYFFNGYGEEVEIEGMTTMRYKMNLTLHLKELIENEIYNSNLTIFPSDRFGNPTYAKFYGSNNSILNPKFNIIYSTID